MRKAYKLVFNYNNKVRYSTEVYETIKLAELALEDFKDQGAVMIIPFYIVD